MTTSMTQRTAAGYTRFAQDLRLAPDELLSLLQGTSEISSRRPAQMTDAELDLLPRSGVNSDDLARANAEIDSGGWARAITMSEVAFLRQTLPVADVAALIGTTDSAVRHRILDRTVMSYKSGRTHRIPTWQLQRDPDADDSAIDAPTRWLDGLRFIIRAVPDGTDVRTMQRFMETETADLDPDREPVSPVTWIRAGQDRRAVIEMLEYLNVT